jgi:hypothetical protein
MENISSTPPTRTIPMVLHIVALIFFGLGIWACIATFIGSSIERVELHSPMLGIPIAMGLYARSRIWRNLAFVMLGFWALNLPFAAFGMVVGVPLDKYQERLNNGPFRQPFATVPVTLRGFGLPFPGLRETPERVRQTIFSFYAYGFFVLFTAQTIMLCHPQVRAHCSRRRPKHNSS